MNLEFGILWIEDSFSPEEEASLKRRVANAGFIARVDTLENGHGLQQLADDHSRYHCIDLILLDFKLKDAKGNELAPQVRQLFPSTTILFYSGSYQENQLRQMIADKQVEGVYCSSRERFIDRAASLIDQTASALDRLSGMRGLAMRVVAECDTIMKRAVLAMSNRHEQCAVKVSELDAEVFAFFDQLKNAYEKSTAGDLHQRLETRAIDSAKLHKHFRRLTEVVTANGQAFGLSEEQMEQLRALRKSSAQYVANVLGKRNVLGHAIEVRGPNGWVLQGSGDITVRDFPAIRGLFASHVDAFREMEKLVCLLDEQKSG